jgi:hypothetical protein
MSSNNNIRNLVSSSKMGGSENMILQSFLAMCILGYFGIKIVYAGFFGFYPDKYYYRGVEIQTSDSSSDLTTTKNVMMNSFIPGLWNNEITDFVTYIVFISIIYVFSQIQSRKMFSAGGFVDLPLAIGFIIGLTYPILFHGVKFNCQFQLRDQCGQYNLHIFTISFFILLLLGFVHIKYTSQHKSSYLIYSLGIVLIIIGLYFTRKLSQTLSSVKYFKTNNGTCTSKQEGYVWTSGDQIVITPAFASWVLLLFFAIEPTNDMTRKLIYFLFGLLLGVFTSSMSYYGIDYFLIKLPEKSCSSPGECRLLEIESDRTDSTITSEEEELGISSGTSTKIAIPNVLLKNTRVFLIFSIIVVLVLFIYMYLTQKK